MILIADGGSTKTTWCLTDQRTSYEHTGMGINPYFLDETDIEKELREVFDSLNRPPVINQVFYYGTGIVNEEKAGLMERLIKKVFRPEEVKAFSDLFGAYRALFGNKTGLAGILGTGTSSGYFEQGTLSRQLPSLGFWLGDEGSGADLGKRFIKAYLRKELDAEITGRFEETYGSFDRLEVFRQIKENSRVNAWFASFVPFLGANLENPGVNQLVESAFNELCEKAILPYKLMNDVPLGFVGSVAFYFEPLLRKVMAQYADNELKILQNPIPALIDFHVTNVQ